MRIILTAALIAIAATPGAARDGNRVPEAAANGKAVDCVALRNIRSTHVRNDRVIDFELVNGQVYRNELPHGCPGLGFDRAFSYRVSTSQLCSIDVITVIRPGGHGIEAGPSCGLGQFQPVTLASR